MGLDLVEAPERIGRYEILLPIAKGGMATVYLARAEGHGGFDRYVALKLTLPHLRSDPEFAAHLLDEAKLVAHIRHTNVVPVLDVGQDKLGVFLVMDYVAGDTLSGLFREAAAQGTALPAPVALRVLVDALEGLHAAHEHGDEDGYPLHLVHRDFSPQNILVGTDGVGRLTDFGIAKAASRVSNTSAGLIKGKMSYVSPEQARGAPLDRRCDLWAAGIIAWEIMCGRKLNTPNDPKSLLSTVKREPPRIRTVVPDAPEAIDAVIASVLKLDPDDRPATAAMLARDLAAAARGAGMLAEPHEVAEHVKRLAGPQLAERKARLAAARRMRIGSVPDGLATAIGVPSPLEAAARAGLAMAAAAAENDLSITVTEGTEPPPPLTPEQEPERGPSTDPTTTTTGIDASAAVQDLRAHAGADDDAPAIPGLAGRGPNLAVVAAGLGFVLLIVIVGVTLKLASGRDAGEKAGAAAVPSAMTSSPSPSPLPAAPAAATETKAATPGVKQDDEQIASAQFLALTTNAPVAEVRVDDRVIDMVIPAPNVTVELEPDETKRAIAVTAKSTDGRIATTTLRAGELEAKLTFAPGRAAAPAAMPAAQPTNPARPGLRNKPGTPRHL